MGAGGWSAIEEAPSKLLGSEGLAVCGGGSGRRRSCDDSAPGSALTDSTGRHSVGRAVTDSHQQRQPKARSRIRVMWTAKDIRSSGGVLPRSKNGGELRNGGVPIDRPGRGRWATTPGSEPPSPESPVGPQRRDPSKGIPTVQAPDPQRRWRAPNARRNRFFRVATSSTRPPCQRTNPSSAQRSSLPRCRASCRL